MDTFDNDKMSNETTMTRRPRRTFTAEQKAEAVRLVKEVGSVTQVARDLDLTRTTMTAWVRQAKVDAGQGPGGALTTEEKAELARLRRVWGVRTWSMHQNQRQLDG